ncbi:MAG: hypothetical protein GY839_04690 [candidate division Zixibacteria bacterium]|nr:hypothetical protein [candidate division Zixibacteria bacterium]
MKKVAILTLLVCFLAASIALADSENYKTNTVYLDKVTAKPGEHFAVKIYLFNTDTLSGCQIPVFYRSENIDLYCDSISIVGSRMEYFMFDDIKLPQTEEDDKVAYISFIDTINPKVYVDALQPGDGLVATVYFTAPEDAPEGVVKLTRGMIPHPHISFIFAVWDPMGNEVDGDFIDGEIIIKK